MVIEGLINSIFFGLISGSIYAFVVIGYSLIYSVLGFINFAHGDLLAVGVYLCWVIGEGYIGIPFFIAIIIAALLTGILSSMIGFFILIPTNKRYPIATLVVAIGVSIIIQNLISLTCTSEARPFYSNIKFENFSYIPVNYLHISILITSTLTLLTLWFGLLKKTKLGLKIRACASNPVASFIFGLQRNRIFGFVFFISGILAALSGIAKGLDDQIINPTIGFSLGIRAFIASVIGGITNIWGAIAGAFILGIIEHMSIFFMLTIPILKPLSLILSKDAIALILLIIILFWKPKGIFALTYESRP